jgi:two-component system KDP operon response regulator KdpE
MTDAAAPAVAVIIDDETQIRRLLRLALEGHGYAVFEAENGRLGLQEIVHRRPDVVLLDLGLPDLEGGEVLRRLREWSSTPVLVLTVRDAEAEKVAALDLGADDYLTKPFSTPELLARLRALRRRVPAAGETPVIVAGDLEIDLAAHQVRKRGEEIRLTATEFALLRVLARHAGKVVTHKQLLREVWGPHAEEHSQYLRVYLTHIRKKIETGDETLIATEPRVGYRLRLD